MSIAANRRVPIRLCLRAPISANNPQSKTHRTRTSLESTATFRSQTFLSPPIPEGHATRGSPPYGEPENRSGRQRAPKLTSAREPCGGKYLARFSFQERHLCHSRSIEKYLNE